MIAPAAHNLPDCPCRLPTRIGSYLPISIAQLHLTSKQGSLQQPQQKQISYVYICLKNAFVPWLHPHAEYPVHLRLKEHRNHLWICLRGDVQGALLIQVVQDRDAALQLETYLQATLTMRPWWLESCWVFIGSDLAEDQGSNLGYLIVWSTERAPTT